MKKLLFISNLYPNPAAPGRGIFNQQQVAALSSYFDIDVVAPIAWNSRNRSEATDVRIEGATRVFHPTYFYTPGILRTCYGSFYKFSIDKLVAGLAAQQNYCAIYSSWLFPDCWAAVALARRISVPCFVKVHGTDVYRLKKGSRLTEVSLSVLNGAASVICVSKALEERLRLLGLQEAKTLVVYNGVDRDVFHPVERGEARAHLGVDPSVPIVLFVGNLKREKGLDELARAFTRLKQEPDTAKTRLIVIGEGAYRKEFERSLLNSRVLEDVEFLGSRSHKEIALWMNAANLLCLPSYSEGVPNVVLEAMRCCLPVVATSVGGIPELAQPGGLINLVPSKDWDSLAKMASSILLGKGRATSALCYSHTWHENAEVLAAHIRQYI